jgi:GAF domain-containing protein
MTIDELGAILAADLEKAAGTGQQCKSVALHLADFLEVTPGDVGIFTYDAARHRLVLVWPPGLRVAGDIPIDSPNALVAVTARERRTYRENDFSTVKHPQFFEHVLPGGTVQKIVSVPVLAGEELLGVLQVCRKGCDRRAVGPDFTPDDSTAVEKVAALLATSAASRIA